MELFFVILEQICVHIPFVLGGYISLSLLKAPDFSLESAYVFGAFVASRVLALCGTLPMMLTLPIVILAGMLGGASVGLTSSLLTKKGGLPHLLSAILTFGLFHGIVQAVSATYVSFGTMENPLLVMPFFARHPELCMLLIISSMVIIGFCALLKTQLGYAYAIYGNNPNFFSHYGISGSYVFMNGIILGNALAGLSGYLFSQSSGFAEITMGSGKLLLCITVIILGKAVIGKRKSFSIAVPLFGICAYFMLQQMLLKLGFNLKYFTAVQACIVICILLLMYKRTQTNARRIDHLGI